MEVFLTIVSTALVQIGICVFCFIKKDGLKA
jgi:hypothetical protein